MESRIDEACRIGLALFMAALVAGCGSGSSGFQPRFAELASILDAAESGECREAPGAMEVCARFAAPGEGATCAADADDCRFVVQIDRGGFAPGSWFVAAVMPQDLSLPWRTATRSFGPADPDGRIVADVEFVTDLPGGTEAMLALVVYPPGTELPDIPERGLDKDLLSGLDALSAEITAGWLVVRE